MPSGVCVLVASAGVNLEDEGLGQPRQVMTAGMLGPSGQLILDISSCCTYKLPNRLRQGLCLTEEEKVDITFKACCQGLLSEDDQPVIVEAFKKEGLYY